MSTEVICSSAILGEQHCRALRMLCAYVYCRSDPSILQMTDVADGCIIIEAKTFDWLMAD